MLPMLWDKYWSDYDFCAVGRMLLQQYRTVLREVYAEFSVHSKEMFC